MICVHPLLYSLQDGAVPVQTPTKTLLPSLKVTVLPSDDTNSRLMAACSEYPSQYSRKSKQGFGIPTHRCVEQKLVIVRSKSLQSMRSEEHTSELQSLMRISYAVFCLKNTPQLKT